MNKFSFKEVNNAKDLLDFFIALAPNFEAYWYDSDNDRYIKDGEQSICGVCSRFAQYYILQERYVDDATKAKNIKWDLPMTSSLNDYMTQELFRFIEGVLEHYENERNELDSSLCVCFLEEISQTKAAEESKHWMGKLSREFFDKWHVYRPSHPLG